MWPAPLERRRRWILGLAAMLVVRAALPLVLRPIIASQASKTLHARVEIGDLDLSLLRGGLALEDVAVRPAGAEPAGGEPPLIAWKRFAVEVRWLPLLRRTVRLRTLEIDSPRLALDRLENGELNLMALVPAVKGKAAPEQPAATSTAEAGWGLGVDRLVLRAGALRFRDFAIRDVEPVEVSLGSIEVTDVALRPGLYGEPARLHLGAKVDQGKLRVDARLTLRGEGLALETDLRAKRLPLRRTRVYIPNVGWSDLRGELTAALEHRFETGARNAVRGTVMLQDVTVQVSGLTEPALAWKRLAVRVDPVDLAAQRVAARTVDLAGASLLVRPQGGDLVPFLHAGAANGKTAAEESPKEAQPWRWSVASLRVADSRVRLLGAEAPVDVGVNVDARGLAGDGTAAAAVAFGLTVGEGSLAADGSLRVAPPYFEGSVKIDQLPLPELVAAAGGLPPHVLQAGRLGAELAIAAGAAAPLNGLRVRGTLSLAEPWLAAADPKEFAVGARSLDLAIDDVAVPDVFAADYEAVPPRPISVRLGELRLTAPYAQLTRTTEGLVLLPLGPAAATAETAPAPSPQAAPAPPPLSPGVELTLGVLRVTQGRVGVTDRTVKPFYTGALSAVEIDVRNLHWPPLAMSRLRLEATSAEQGRIEVRGALASAGGWLEVNGNRIALRSFNPYATSFSPYSIARGTLSLSTKATFGNGRYDATSSLTLHDFDLGSRTGESRFQEQFGIPLSMALALLRDVRGDIALDLPVAVDREGTKIGLLSVVGGALRRAFLNALASPLKLFGAVLQGDRVEGVAPAPIAFRAGRPALAPAGAEQMEQLAAFLASRPGIGVTLGAVPSMQDVRWLREQALREEIAAPQGIFGTAKNLRQRGARERIRIALEARARDEAGALEAEDADTLERWLAERAPLAPERLRALEAARFERIETLLRSEHGIAAERIARREPQGETTEDPPAVRFEIGPVGAGKSE